MCRDDDTQVEACGLNGRGGRQARCVLGAWRDGDCVDPDACVDGAIRDEACGLNGRGDAQAACAAGQWRSGDCADPDACVDGDSRPEVCGVNGRGASQGLCAGGQWQTGACVDPDECVDGDVDVAPCPFGPDRRRACVDGRWAAWPDCAVRADGLVINEVYIDPPGFDHRASFIELWGPPDTELDGVSVVAVNGLNGDTYGEVELAGPLPADGFYVIAHPGVEGDTLAAVDLIDRVGDLQNGPDAVQLWRGGERIDALAYGDSDYGEGAPAPDPDALSLSRHPEGRDSDDNFADFIVVEPTPGAGLALVCVAGQREVAPCGLNGRGASSRACDGADWGPWGPCEDPDVCVDGTAEDMPCGLNDRGRRTRACDDGAWGAWGACADPDVCVDGAVEDGPCDHGPERQRSCVDGRWTPWPDCPPGPERLVVNEAHVAPLVADKFIELWGTGGMDLDGVTVVALDGPDGRAYAELALAGTMPADGFYVISETRPRDEVGAAADVEDDFADLQRGGGALQLWRDGQLVDALAYGDAVGGEGDPAPWPGWLALTRVPRGQDTDDNFTDFTIAAPTPGRGQPDLCAEDREVEPCGLDDRGSRIRYCADGLWAPWGACQCSEAGPCGLNGRGSRIRDCGDGSWGPWGACEDPDVCLDGEIGFEPCDGGRRARECVEGRWWIWPNCECIPGAVQEAECGLNARGLKARSCRDDGLWPIWDACEDPDVCVDGARDEVPCAGGALDRECVAGAWRDGPCHCVAGAVEEQPCGVNGRGRAHRECVADAWAPWSACEDPDVCEDGAADELPCDAGVYTRRCEAGAWVDEPCHCVPGTVEEQPCGVAGRGRSHRECVADAWSPWSACDDPDACVEGSVEDLPCDAGVYTRRCEAGVWVDEPCRCAPGSVEDEVCGFNARGMRSRTCGPQGWAPWAACDDPDVCADGAAEDIPCHDGMLTRTCAAGHWQNGECQCIPGAVDSRSCGLNGDGERTRPCVDGAWGPWGPCDDPDVCIDGTVDHMPCPGAVQPRACLHGQWVAGGCGCDVPHLSEGGQAFAGGWITEVLAEGWNTDSSCSAYGAEGARWFVVPATGEWHFGNHSPDGHDTALTLRGSCNFESEFACTDNGEGGDTSQLTVWLEEGDFVYIIADQPWREDGGRFVLSAWQCALADGGCEGPRTCWHASQRPVECADGSIGAELCEYGDWFESLCTCDLDGFFDLAEPVGDGRWTLWSTYNDELPPDACGPQGYVDALTLTAPAAEAWVLTADPPVALQAQRNCGDRRTAIGCAPPGGGDGALIVPLGADETAAVLVGRNIEDEDVEVTASPCSLLDVDHPCRVASPCGDGTEWQAPCGLNGRGYGLRRCDGGAWSVVECDDPDVCTDGERRGTDSPCPDGTLATDRCVDGAWSAVGCLPATCAPGEHVEVCGRFGRGQRVRLCTYTDGAGWDFEPWSPCDDPDTCDPVEPGCFDGYPEGGYGAQGILRVAGLDRDTLWNPVGLGRVLSLAITDEQQVSPTSTWPGWTWPSLAALTAVAGVDGAALDLMFDYASDRGWNGRCGDGRVQPGNEQCDDGGVADGDGCAADCTLETVCGDGVVEGAEQCDAPGAECDAICRHTTLPVRQNVALGRHRQVARRVLMEPDNNVSSRASRTVEITVPQRARLEVRTETGPRFGWYGSTACPRITYTTNNDIGARNFLTDFRPTVRFWPVAADGDDIIVPSPTPCNTDVAVELPPSRYQMVFTVDLPGGAIREDAIIDFTAFIDGWTPLGGPVCGDGVIEDPEECDDGDQRALNCQSNCRWPRIWEWSNQADGPLMPPSDTVIGVGSIDLDDTPRDTDIFHIELAEPSDVFIGLTTPEGDCAFDASLILRHDADAVGNAGSAPSGPDGCPEIARSGWPAGASTIRVRGVPDVGNFEPYRLTVTRSPAD